MIIDAHCHAWEQWPYDPPVPDKDSRGRAERLIWEMDQCGVDKAVLISAGIRDNPANSRYAHASAAQSGGRLLAFPDVDCRWSPTHHTPGAAARLQDVVAELNPPGFTHYLDETADPSWLTSPEGIAFFSAAASHNLIVSLACGPSQMPTVRELAARFPATPFLIHHVGRVRAAPRIDREALAMLLDAAAAPNIYVKLSGFGYATDDGWNFPCAPAIEIAKTIHGEFGPDRLCWGSDYPVSQRFMTYRQALELVRTHCTFLTSAEKALVLGGVMSRLLETAGKKEVTTP